MLSQLWQLPSSGQESGKKEDCDGIADVMKSPLTIKMVLARKTGRFSRNELILLNLKSLATFALRAAKYLAWLLLAVWILCICPKLGVSLRCQVRCQVF